MRHVVVESGLAVRAWEASGQADGAVFHTPSPGLLSRLAGRGLEARSIEASMGLDEYNALGRAGYAFALDFGRALNEACAWRDYADLESLLGGSLVRVFFVSLYKAMLLGRLAAGADGPLTVVGDPAAPPIAGLDMTFGRLDTLYAHLAARHGLDVLEHVPDVAALAALERGVVHRRMGLPEKISSLLNNTPSSFACKLWRNLAARGLLPFRHVGLRPRARGHLYLGKDCELIDEAFLDMLRAGERVGQLPALPGVRVPDDAPELPERAALAGAFDAAAERALEAEGLDAGVLRDAGLGLARERALGVLARLHAALPELNRGFAALVDGFAPRAGVLENGRFDVPGRLFAAYCRRRGVPVTTFEHGITLGLSEWTRLSVRYFGVLTGETGVYHLPSSRDDAAAHAPQQRRVLGGVPRVTRRVVLPGLQRRLARGRLGAEPGEKVVIFVAEMERNNLVFGPHSENDLHFAAKTEAALEETLAAFPDSRIWIKPYPSFRYLESFDYEAFARSRPRVQIIGDMDFRFIRAGADAIVLTSSQSTLGWALGSGADCYFYPYDWAPVAFLDTSRPGPGKLRLLDAGAILAAEGGDATWYRRLAECGTGDKRC